MSILDTIKNTLKKTYEAREKIRQAIIDQGVDVPEGTPFNKYSEKIAEIEIKDDEYYKDLIYSNTDNGTNFSHFFDTSLSEGKSVYAGGADLSVLDTSKAEDMSYMFQSCGRLLELDVYYLNTSNVTNMRGMFACCETLPIIYGLYNFDTSKVTDMHGMFADCYSLVELNLYGWDTSNVTDMSYMFEECWSLTTIIGELDASNVTSGFSTPRYGYNDYYHTFTACTQLKTLYIKNIYKNCDMTNDYKWSIKLGSTQVKDECLIYIINELPDLINDKGLTDTSSIMLTLPTTNTLTEEQVQVAINKGWNVANITY